MHPVAASISVEFWKIKEDIGISKRTTSHFRTSYRSRDICLDSGSFINLIVGSMEAPSKAFLLFFLLPDWLKLNHLKSGMECGFSDMFWRHIRSTLAETMGVTDYAASFGA